MEDPWQDSKGFLGIGCKHRQQTAALSDSLTERFTVGSGQRRFTSGIDLEQHQGINAGQHPDKVIKQIAGSRLAMGLVGHHQTTIRPDLEGGTDHRGYFGGVMTIIINQRDLHIADGNIPADFETPGNS